MSSLRVRGAVHRSARQVPVEDVPRVERDVVDHPDAGLDVEHEVDLLAHLLPIGSRHAEQRRDHVGREPRAEVLDVVERLAPSRCASSSSAHSSRIARLELRDAPRV